MMLRSTTESEPAALGREQEPTCFHLQGRQTWSETSQLGAGPTLRARYLGACMDHGHRAITRDPTFPSSDLKNSKAPYFFLTY